MEDKVEGMLNLYRVLDLTDEKGLLCGKLLGDLGADVIKIERPGGDPARNLGPFYHDEPDSEKSLFWFAFNTSKRGITLDIETADGQEIFKRLVKSADFVIESFPPGYLDKLGLGYSALEKINPQIIMVSITSFGQTGPYRDYKASDIVAWAMGGQMYSTGNADRPPLRISHHSQAYLHAGQEAAVGAMIALHYREMMGEGQQVDVSIQECLAQATQLLTSSFDMMKIIKRRGRGIFPDIDLNLKLIWPCKDGHVYFRASGVIHARRTKAMVEWMEEEGMANDFIKGIDWETLDYRTVTQETVCLIEEPIGKFFLAHTKAELLAGALKRNVMLYPIYTTADVLEGVQLAARGYWVEIEHHELGTSITYPGAFTKASEAPPGVSRRAPLIGEHNQEIFGKDSGISGEKSLMVRQVEGHPVELSKKSQWKKPGEKPLEGVKVIDFTWAAVGPISTKTLADWGAEVIKIESQSKPDSIRVAGPHKDGIPGLNRSGDFARWNTGKLSIAINLARPKGVEVAKRLVAWADIVVENFAGGVMERIGLGYEELRKVKPGIIMLSSCMQGQTGPYANHPGTGYHLTGLAGFHQITGWPDRPPTAPEGPYIDFIAPRFSALAALAALDYRRRTGKGQYIDMSQYENGVHFMAPLILDYVVNRRTAKRVGNRYPYAAPHGAYRCRGEDRWCAIAVFTEEEWQNFGKVIGNPAWTSDPRFSTLSVRRENEDELDKLVEEWTVNYSAENVMARMQAAMISTGVLENAEDLLMHDPQLRHRHSFWELDHPEIGKHYVHGPSFVLSKSSYELRRAPLLGEHNQYALKEIIGMSDGEIADLVLEGVIE